MAKTYTLDKLTNCKWLNQYEVRFQRESEAERSWLMCSRKAKPIAQAAQADAVVIVPTIETDQGRRLVVTKEFRVPIWDYEYGFPAGLIDEGEGVEATIARELKEETGLDLVKIRHVSSPVFSSAGLTDESCNMALVEATGTVSTQWQEHGEDIETLLMDVHDIQDLLASDKKVAAKAWGLLYHYVLVGRID